MYFILFCPSWTVSFKKRQHANLIQVTSIDTQKHIEPHSTEQQFRKLRTESSLFIQKQGTLIRLIS